jgi:uncharacterized membrane protein YgcG
MTNAPVHPHKNQVTYITSVLSQRGPLLDHLLIVLIVLIVLIIVVIVVVRLLALATALGRLSLRRSTAALGRTCPPSLACGRRCNHLGRSGGNDSSGGGGCGGTSSSGGSGRRYDGCFNGLTTTSSNKTERKKQAAQ